MFHTAFLSPLLLQHLPPLKFNRQGSPGCHLSARQALCSGTFLPVSPLCPQPPAPCLTDAPLILFEQMNNVNKSH